MESNRALLTERDIINENFTAVPKPFMRMALRSLVEKQFLTPEDDDDGHHFGWSLHPLICDDAYDFVQAGYQIIPKTAPAANRFVPIDHNSQPYKDADSSLDELSAQISGDNSELFADPADRVAVLSEVNGIRELIKGTMVRATAVLAATRDSGVLSWLAQQTASELVRTFAAKAIAALLALIK